MGEFKRTIRDWKKSISASWGKLKTFHRIALGITIAMMMIYAARKYMLDPKLRELNKLIKQNEKTDMPEFIPDVSDDSDVVEAELKIESLEPQVAKRGQEKLDALKSRPQVSSSDVSDALAVFEALISRAGLELHNRWRYTNSEDISEIPMTRLVYKYRLLGTFGEIYSFLQNMELFKYPSLMKDIDIKRIDRGEDSTVSAGEGTRIVFEFNLELYCNDE